MDNTVYYAIALLMIVIGIVICKKVAGCLVKSIVTFLLVAVLTVLYFIFFHQ
jgi:hypothetical protein